MNNKYKSGKIYLNFNPRRSYGNLKKRNAMMIMGFYGTYLIDLN